MNTRTHIDTPSLPLLRRASTLIAMGTVGLALVVAAPASAEDTPTDPTTTITTTTDSSNTTRTVTYARPIIRDVRPVPPARPRL